MGITISDIQWSESKSKLPWVIGLTLASISITVSIVVAIIIGFAGMQWLVIPFVLRGTVVAAWLFGLVFILTSVAAITVRSRKTYATLITVLLVIGFLFAIMTLVAGADLAKVFTSPVTLSENLGDAFSKALSNSSLAPKSMRGPGGESVINTVTRISASIAIMQLIGFLPFPYNMMLFFIYYKFVTVLIVCLIPLGFALWAVFQVYSARIDILEDNVETVSDDDYGTFNQHDDRGEEEGFVTMYRTPAQTPRHHVRGGQKNGLYPPILSPSSTFHQA